ncbi:ABC transporter ATP-binding protein [bacterium]|uniref:Macrolide ABC transporter ATP-binding protein n=2 Tax=Katanobacteria TaxID=422282 RepID=A0A2M7X4F2_UNCKA|nr:ABC transporter ATP-binding protein [bacterium]NCS96919.1 ABC transporter ATP-binding protein [bacterium]PIP56607.1 MAG: macrolide ABC transporter ATP-binding protein [candidate division WWE3 bacterium CG22_combo_CG10-13_8_21_14_all_39_12]PJA41053.1 MAG: macrolide ABC transporter ATP-binding protein [candidate division WWE3 bacterium CG_4_9_14_3_um_filter_39_7]
MISLENVEKVFIGKINVPVLHEINLFIKQGEMVALKGPSGSGKSTLMNIIGLLDRPTAGTVTLGNEVISLDMSDTKLAHLRSSKIGFVFQSFNLLPRLSALENVLVPAGYSPSKKNTSANRTRAEKLLTSVGLNHRLNHKPNELSGGEKQRVAIARALINNPELILADEPTGNLDSKSGAEVFDIFTDLKKEGKTIVIVTHDDHIAKSTQRIVNIRDGRIDE